MKPQQDYSNAAKILGMKIEAYRKAKGLTPYALGRAINVKEQQIIKYEKGALVPLRTLEKIADALHEGAQKKIIRRISFLRKLEDETGEEQPELKDWYSEIFPDTDYVS